jgi:hypothetical protein
MRGEPGRAYLWRVTDHDEDIASIDQTEQPPPDDLAAATAEDLSEAEALEQLGARAAIAAGGSLDADLLGAALRDRKP